MCQHSSQRLFEVEIAHSHVAIRQRGLARLLAGGVGPGLADLVPACAGITHGDELLVEVLAFVVAAWDHAALDGLSLG